MSRHRQDEWEAREAALVDAAEAAAAAKAVAAFSGPDSRWFVWRSRRVIDRFVVDMSGIEGLFWSDVDHDGNDTDDHHLHIRYRGSSMNGVWPDSEGARALYAAFLRYVGVDP